MVARMITRILFAALVTLVIAAPAHAHPHVWVTMHTELVYAPDGSITGMRHAWSFDDMFSTFATQGLESKEKGKFTREELAPLAKVNVESLKEFDYFTYATADGKKVGARPTRTPDYWLDYKDEVLTLNFTLAVQDAGEGERAEGRNLRSDHLRRTSRSPRRSRRSLSARRPTASSTCSCRAK